MLQFIIPLSGKKQKRMWSFLISLVIPAYNEQDVIESTIKKSLDFLTAKFSSFEIIVVNDASSDGTLLAAQKYESEFLKVISYSENRGKGFALKTGIAMTTGDKVFFTDADLAYGLSYIENAAQILDGCDVVIGSRRLDKLGYKEYSIPRKIMSHGFSFVSNLVLGLGLNDTQCGFKGFKGAAAREIFAKTRVERFGIDFEVLLLAKHMKLDIKEIAVMVINHSKSSVSPVRDSLHTLRELFYVRSLYK